MSERILLLGGGGREHAMAVALSRSPSCSKLWCAPGNPGMRSSAECIDLQAANPAAVLAWCAEHTPSLIVIGPEQPLQAGVADVLRRSGYPVFGPSQSAAQLESSKGFAKDFMLRHAIPTAPYERCTDRAQAIELLPKFSLPVVVKYDGLAAGKGVVVATTSQQAEQAVDTMFSGTYGTDGVVIEGFLSGVEASIFAVTDGTNYVTLAPSHDHKRVGDADTGANTGGMGSVAPSPRVTSEVLHRVCTRIIEPTLNGMREEGAPFIGCLYCGVMIDATGNPFVVEYNARFGDPETQTVLAVLNADVAALFASAARGNLDPSCIVNSCEGAAACVVLASAGYPDAYSTGHPISGLSEAEKIDGVTIFHAGTRTVCSEEYQEEMLVTAGGRVFGVTAHGDDLAQAVSAAYQACACVDFEGKYHRTDIGRI